MLDRIVGWAEADENLRVLIVTGSMAREATDALSDIDLELYAREPSRLLDSTDWYCSFGDVLVVEALPNPWWHPTRLVHYVGGKVDFLIAAVTDVATAVYRRPFRVLVDKDALTGHLHIEPKGTRPPPAAEEFLECVHWFFAEALMAAKCIVRDELWMSKSRDAELKSMLLRMLEWDHRARYGPDYDTWYLGTHWRDWMDPDVQSALRECWAGADPRSSATALMNSIALFVRAAQRTAAALRQPAFDYRKAAREVQRCLALLERSV